MQSLKILKSFFDLHYAFLNSTTNFTLYFQEPNRIKYRLFKLFLVKQLDLYTLTIRIGNVNMLTKANQQLKIFGFIHNRCHPERARFSANQLEI